MLDVLLLVALTLLSLTSGSYVPYHHTCWHPRASNINFIIGTNFGPFESPYSGLSDLNSKFLTYNPAMSESEPAATLGNLGVDIQVLYDTAYGYVASADDGGCGKPYYLTIASVNQGDDLVYRNLTWSLEPESGAWTLDENYRLKSAELGSTFFLVCYTEVSNTYSLYLQTQDIIPSSTHFLEGGYPRMTVQLVPATV